MKASIIKEVKGTDMLRKCNTCGLEAFTEEDLDLFLIHKESKYNRQNRCKQCHNKADSSKKAKLKHRVFKEYGITLNEYTTIMENAVECEICGSNDKLCYDHDHNTGEFRGVLCSNCNTGIGLLQDDEDTLLRAIEYLQKNGSYSKKRY